MALLAAEELEKTYTGGAAPVTALRGVSLTLDAGDFVALMGPSGCGKSTLLHLCGAMDRPTRGPADLRRARPGDARRRRADAAAPRPHRLRVPVLQPAADAHPRRQHRPALPARRAAGGRGRGARRASWRSASASRTASPTTRSRSRAARCSAPPSPAPWCTGRRCSSPTSRPATSTRRTARRVLALLARAQPRPRHHDPAGDARRRRGAGRAAASCACATDGSTRPHDVPAVPPVHRPPPARRARPHDDDGRRHRRSASRW